MVIPTPPHQSPTLRNAFNLPYTSLRLKVQKLVHFWNESSFCLIQCLHSQRSFQSSAPNPRQGLRKKKKRKYGATSDNYRRQLKPSTRLRRSPTNDFAKSLIKSPEQCTRRGSRANQNSAPSFTHRGLGAGRVFVTSRLGIGISCGVIFSISDPVSHQPASRSTECFITYVTTYRRNLVIDFFSWLSFSVKHKINKSSRLLTAELLVCCFVCNVLFCFILCCDHTNEHWWDNVRCGVLNNLVLLICGDATIPWWSVCA